MPVNPPRKPYQPPAIRYEKPVQALATTCQGPTFKSSGGKDNEGNPCQGTAFS